MPSPIPSGQAWLRSPAPEKNSFLHLRVYECRADVEQGATDEGLKRMASSAIQGYLQDLKVLTPGG